MTAKDSSVSSAATAAEVPKGWRPRWQAMVALIRRCLRLTRKTVRMMGSAAAPAASISTAMNCEAPA